MPLILAEDDRVLRMLAVILDPQVPPERHDALADFMAHDVPDFAGWLAETRAQFQGLFPSQVVFVGEQQELLSRICEADAVVVESLAIGEAELAQARRLRIVQKFGTVTRNVDLAACADHGVPVAFLRRRQNIAVAEHAFALTLALAKRLNELDHVVTADRLNEAGFDATPFDRRYTANSNFGRVPGFRTLHGATAGVIGYGEIGREYAQRAAAFGMKILYTQRTDVQAGEVAGVEARFRSLEALLRESDVVSVHLPLTDQTRGLIGARAAAASKAGHDPGQHGTRRYHPERGADAGAGYRPPRRLRPRHRL